MTALRSNGLLSDIVAFTRILFSLGIFDKYRGEFWRFLFRVFKEHRERFGYGVTLAAMGYHFRKLTDFYCT